MWFLDVYRHKFNILLPPGKRPDFFARTKAGEWLALEAKGRSNKPSDDGLTSAKAQARALKAVNRTAPAAHVVCWTRCSQGAVVARIHDPPTGEAGDGLHLNIPPEDLVRRYYSPVEAIMEASEEQGSSQGVTMYHFTAGDFSIGLHPQVQEALQSDNLESLLDTSAPRSRRQGAPLLTANDFLDVRALASQLVSGSSPILRSLWERLPDRTKMVAEHEENDEALRAALVGGLNHALEGPSIYKPEAFVGVVLSPETQKMLRNPAQAVATIELNRVLLEDAFPRMVARSHDFAPIGDFLAGPDGVIVVPGLSWPKG
jgi:hypothetical protein